MIPRSMSTLEEGAVRWNPHMGPQEESLPTSSNKAQFGNPNTYKVHVCPIQPGATEAAFAFAGAPQPPVQPGVKDEYLPKGSP